MAWAFDTLGYSKRLRDAGVPSNHAEAHAEATRDFVMTELVPKTDLLATKSELLAVIETQTLRLTVRLGGIAIAIACVGVVVASIGVLAFFLRLH